jgi:hypothetical protein
LQQAATHREFAQWLTSELVPLLKMGVGLFYSFDETRFRLDLLGSYGLRLDGNSADSYMPGEGWSGSAPSSASRSLWTTCRKITCTSIPAAASAPPSTIAILPVLYRDRLIGVLEMAGFTAIEPL